MIPENVTYKTYEVEMPFPAIYFGIGRKVKEDWLIITIDIKQLLDATPPAMTANVPLYLIAKIMLIKRKL